MITNLFGLNDIRMLQRSMVLDFPLNMFIYLHHQKINKHLKKIQNLKDKNCEDS